MTASFGLIAQAPLARASPRPSGRSGPLCLTLRATTGGWDLRLNGERLSLFETFFAAERTALSAASRHHDKPVEVQTASGTIDLLRPA